MFAIDPVGLLALRNDYENEWLESFENVELCLNKYDLFREVACELELDLRRVRLRNFLR